MSAKSNNSNSKLDRPFDKALMAQAKDLAERYSLVLVSEDGEWYGHALEMPNVFGDGKTVQQCAKDTIAALTAAVATLLERGAAPPMPASEGKRTEQTNVRLSVEEKAVLTALAKSSGFKGLGDYLRAKALGD